MDDQIVAVEQKTILFYDDQLIAVRGDDEQIYVSIRHLCEALGLARQGQIRRIRDHEVLAEGYKGGNVLLPPSSSGRGGGTQKTKLLRSDLIPLWLSGIRAKAVKEEIRPRLVQYQKEVGKVLNEAFRDGRLSLDPTFSELLKNENSPSVQAYKLAQAMMQMAQQQIMLESRIDNHEQRIEQLETMAGDTGRNISPGQASQISQAVKAISMELGKRSGRNEYGGVYGELYRRFEITSYKQLPTARFDEASKFLTDWYMTITGSELPF